MSRTDSRRRRSSRRLLAIAMISSVLLMVAGAAPARADDGQATLELYWGDGCPYCEAEQRFLEGLRTEYPDLTVREYEVWHDEQNRQRLVETAASHGFEPQAVPVTFFRERSWEGFNESIAEEIEAAVASAFSASRIADATGPRIDVPLIGTVELADQSLLVGTLLIGFVDGLNPCSLWVLSMLLALVIHSGSRRRVLAVGTVFLVVTTALYGLYIVGLYSVLSYVSYLGWIRLSVALLALAFGLVNVKDYLWFRKGPSLTIDERHKPKLYRQMRGLADLERPLPGVLGATAAMAVGVSLIETPCTAGFPVLWTGMLATHDVAFTVAALLFGVYMLVFLVDELVVFGVAVATLRMGRLQEREGRVLKLVGGVVMITLAGVLVFAPELMESVVGAVAVFAIAAAAVAAFLAIHRLVLPRLGVRLGDEPEPGRKAAVAGSGRRGRSTDGSPHRRS